MADEHTMMPVSFPEANCLASGGGSKAMPVCETDDNALLSCWAFQSWRDRLRVLVTGRVWVSQRHHEGTINPIWIDTECPILAAPEADDA